MKKNKIIFAILVAVFTIILTLIAVFIIPIRKYNFPHDKNRANVVIVGDSIFCNVMESDSLGTYLANSMEADIYNYSIGGTTASRINWDGEVDYYLDKFNFYNMSDIMVTGNKATIYDNVRSILFVSDQAVINTEQLAATDLGECDYLIINYGINDYLADVPATSEAKNNEGCFEGAMRKGISEISKAYPNLKIIVTTLPYIHLEYTDDDTVFDSMDDERATLYIQAVQNIASEYDNVYCFDTNEYLPMNKSNYDEYHVDGIHYNAKAKEILTAAMTEYIGGIQ